MKAKIKEVESWKPEFYKPGALYYEWCCDCNLRHVVQYDIVTKGGKRYVTQKAVRDDWATEARRRLKNLARRKKHGSKRRA